jgi:hypothetical protein
MRVFHTATSSHRDEIGRSYGNRRRLADNTKPIKMFQIQTCTSVAASPPTERGEIDKTTDPCSSPQIHNLGGITYCGPCSTQEMLLRKASHLLYKEAVLSGMS